MANVSSVKTNVKTGEVDGFYDPQFQRVADEFVRRVSGKPLGTFFREEVNVRGQSLVDAAYLSLGYNSNASGGWLKY